MEQQEFFDSLENYTEISQMLKTHSYEDILKTAAAIVQLKPEELEQYPMGGFERKDKRSLPICPAGSSKKHPAVRLAVFPAVR